MQGAEVGPRSDRFTRDQAFNPLRRTASSAAQPAPSGAVGGAFSPAPFEVQRFSGVQDAQPEAGDKTIQNATGLLQTIVFLTA